MYIHSLHNSRSVSFLKRKKKNPTRTYNIHLALFSWSSYKISSDIPRHIKMLYLQKLQNRNPCSKFTRIFIKVYWGWTVFIYMFQLFCHKPQYFFELIVVCLIILKTVYIMNSLISICQRILLLTHCNQSCTF